MTSTIAPYTTTADTAVADAIAALDRLAAQVISTLDEDVATIRRVLDTARDTPAIRTVLALDEDDRQTGRAVLEWREVAIAHSDHVIELQGKLDGANACWQRAQAELDAIRGDRP